MAILLHLVNLERSYSLTPCLMSSNSLITGAVMQPFLFNIIYINYGKIRVKIRIYSKNSNIFAFSRLRKVRLESYVYVVMSRKKSLAIIKPLQPFLINIFCINCVKIRSKPGNSYIFGKR